MKIVFAIVALTLVLAAQTSTTVEPGWPGRAGITPTSIPMGTVLCWNPDATNSYGNCVTQIQPPPATGLPWRWATGQEFGNALATKTIKTVPKPAGF